MTKEYAAKQLAARGAEVPAEPFGALPPIDEQQPDAVRLCEPLATGAPAEAAWLDEAGPVVLGIDLSTAPATSGTIITGPGSSTWLDTYTAPLATAEPREFTKLGERWEAEADAAAEQHLIGQLYEAGHPGPFECGPCRGACGVCLK